MLHTILKVYLMQPKKRGRQKGSKNKLSRDVARMLGEATLYYAHCRYEEVRFLVKIFSIDYINL